MGMFDGLNNTFNEIKNQASQSIGDFIQSTGTKALVSIGLPPSGNLSQEELAAGITSKPNLSPGPTSSNIADVANAAAQKAVTVIPYAAIGLALVAVYFLAKGKK